MAEDETAVLRMIQAQLAEIRASENDMRALQMAHGKLFSVVRQELGEIRVAADNVTRTSATADTIDSIHADVDHLQQQFSDQVKPLEQSD
jgi:septation ring formation regulator EzrA